LLEGFGIDFCQILVFEAAIGFHCQLECIIKCGQV
jgi:hypothetical protein